MLGRERTPKVYVATILFMKTGFEEYFKNGAEFLFENGIYDFLSSKQYNPYELSEIELDYHWNFREDPIITPTIIHEWDYLDRVMSKQVTRNAEIVLSIGGGGSSRTQVYLTDRTAKLIIHNPGVWDLVSYPTICGRTEIFKVRGIGEYLPYKDQSVDAIEIPSTLDHVINPRQVISEAFRVLRPGGAIGITLGNNKSWYRRVINLLRIRVTDNHSHAHNFHFNSEEIEELLSALGFIEVRTIGTAFLKLPKYLERKIRTRRVLDLHRFFSNQLLSKFMPANSGGMFVVTGRRP